MISYTFIYIYLQLETLSALIECTISENGHISNISYQTLTIRAFFKKVNSYDTLSSPVLGGFHVPQYLVFYVVFCR